jgi:hypothetical protein
MIATVAIQALALSVIGITLSVPIGIGMAKLLERDPADWRAFLHLRFPRKFEHRVIVTTGVPTASSATIVSPPPWQSPSEPPRLQQIRPNDTGTDGRMFIAT